MKQRWLTIILLTFVGGASLFNVSIDGNEVRVLSYLNLRGWIGGNHTSPLLITPKATLKRKVKGIPEWWDSPYWETDFINWNETYLYTHPVFKEKPSYIKLTTAMLRSVSEDNVVFWGRNPDGGMRVHISPSGVPKLTEIHSSEQWNNSLGTWTTLGHSALMNNDTDYTAIITFDGLPSDTPFKYVIQLYINGTWYNHLFGTFQTFPKPGAVSNQSLIFAFGSCINPHIKGSATGASLRLLASYSPALRFFLFIGDFIYFWDELEHTRQEYLPFYYRKLATREVVNAMRSSPWFFQFDDHEVHNDYVSGPRPDPNSSVHREFLFSWDNMIAKANPKNPPAVVGKIPPEDLPFVRWYQFSHGNAHYFVADVRSYKVNNGDLTGQLLGPTQFSALETWVKTKCLRKLHSWCFFVSPTVFSHGSYREDLWYGNMKEQKEVVKLFTESNETCPISVLSGDSHIAAAWEVADTVHEFTCSPVDAFALFFPWKKPPSQRKKNRRGWPTLGDLPPPRAFFEYKPHHLSSVGLNCLIEVTTTVTESSVQVSTRFDLVDGFSAKLVNSHIQNYSHPK